jgi:hypothetical protein
LALVTLVGSLMIAGQSTRANVVLDWNALAIDAIRNDDTGPTLSTRNLAILHTSIYDAVNSIQRTHQPYRFQVDPSGNASIEGAAVAAAYEVMTSLYPSFKARADALYLTYLDGVPPTPDLTNGIAVGRQVAQLTLESRADDGSQTDVPYIPSDAPGQWRRTPPLFLPPLTPQWRYVTPFCLPDIDPFVPGPPPALDSPEYAEDFNEVKVLGAKDSTVRTAEQSQIAEFWSDFSYTSMPPGHWHEIAAAIAQDRQLDLGETARLFALISLAQADAAIVCWETKYRYNLWRPITAIQGADDDNNPATTADPAWNQFLNSPPFPSYTSGHSTFSKASAEILTSFFGTDALSFSIGSDKLPGVIRSFASVAACADEVGQSRIYGGIHFQFDNREGKAMGKRIANYISANFLLPNEKLPTVRLEALTNGSPLLRVLGHFGATSVLESTHDFVNWQPVATNTTLLGGNLILDSAAPSTRVFYRVRE